MSKIDYRNIEQAYAYDHLAEIEADLASDDEAAVKARLAGDLRP
ncbi:MAG TPA: hypothetical protein VGN42_26360 [Pirellulales bacterium]|jgi:hypothetical protein|nr:hypothetical protein [Pirellulales bacterium]